MLDKLKDLDADDIQEVVQLVQDAQALEPLIDATLATAIPWIQKLREPIEQLHTWQTTLDVRQFNAYVAGGMTADQAVTLMIHRHQQVARVISAAPNPKKART
jgi:tRNA A37 N6-isopentenylltransferase MiaA